MKVLRSAFLAVLLVAVAVPAWAQSMGVLSTPLNVATVSRTNAKNEGQVTNQGSGVKIRLLGFLLTSDRMIQVQFRDSTGTACTGPMVIATGGSVNAPVAPPGYICETGANARLDLNISNTALSIGNPTIGGALMWQQSQ